MRPPLAVNSFSQRAMGLNLRDIVGIDLTPVGGWKVMRIETFIVPQISQGHNEHLEIACRDYPDMTKIWLSNFCKSSEHLEIDLLIGADYLRSFQTGNTPYANMADHSVVAWNELYENEASWAAGTEVCSLHCQVGRPLVENRLNDQLLRW